MNETMDKHATASGAAEIKGDGRRTLMAKLSVAGMKQLRIMAAEQDRSQQDIIVEAMNDVFKKHGKQPIA